MRTLNDLILNITDGRRAAHAFIIEGRSGEARDAFITGLAKGLECTSPEEDKRPCGICPSCRQIAAGTSLDVVRMNKSPGSSKTARPSYKTDDAAEFIERLSMGSYGRFLIGIIDDADSLSEVIQNKLLKTLEEPSPDTVLLLGVSNKDDLLSTVRSRCSDIRMADYASDISADTENGEAVDPDASAKAIAALVGIITDPDCRFYKFRSEADKNIKSREDALLFLDLLEDELRRRFTAPEGGSTTLAAMQDTGRLIELTAVSRMDIKREMAYGKALRRLFLELRQPYSK